MTPEQEKKNSESLLEVQNDILSKVGNSQLWEFAMIWMSENPERPGDITYGFNFDLQPIGTVIMDKSGIKRTAHSVMFNRNIFPNKKMQEHLLLEINHARKMVAELMQSQRESQTLISELEKLDKVLISIANDHQIFLNQ